MSYLFVDQIQEHTTGQRICGCKLVRPDELYLTIGRANHPALLPAVVGEALGQLGAWSVMHASQFQYRPVAGVVDQVTIYDDAYVGDLITLTTEIVTWDEQAIDYHSVATVDGRKILAIDHAIGPMLPMTEFNDPQRMQQLFIELSNAQTPWVEDMQTSLPSPCALIRYDQMVDWQPGVQVIATKYIPAKAAYFAEHFPRKPVLPLTMLLSANLALAQQWLMEWQPSIGSSLVPYQLRKIKMRNFIAPETTVTTVIKLKAQHNDQIVLQIVNQVDTRTVCGLEVIFHDANTQSA
ncbi:MAG: hypothetical protein GKR77_04240 [Legionellales bacterium]|nr:hypothetical protein [Legionellales bacterium]